MSGEFLVFQGQSWQATHHQAVLEAHGIEVIPVYLPTVEGHELYVDARRAREAELIVHQESQRLAGNSIELEDGLEPETAALAVLGKRIRSLARSMVLAPAGLVLGFVYLARAWRVRPRPPGHADTLLAWTACWAFSVAIGIGWWILFP